MSKFSMFMKENKKKAENARYAPTRSLCGADGKPLEWEFRHISSRENNSIREECYVTETNPKKPNTVIQQFKTSKYLEKLIIKSTVYPDLYDKELQDSYGVMSPEELLYAMVDNSSEFDRLVQFIQGFNGDEADFGEKVNEAKNS